MWKIPSTPAKASTGTLKVSAAVAPFTRMPPLVSVSVVPVAPPMVKPVPLIASAFSVFEDVNVVDEAKLLLVICSVSVARAALISEVGALVVGREGRDAGGGIVSGEVEVRSIGHRASREEAGPRYLQRAQAPALW